MRTGARKLLTTGSSFRENMALYRKAEVEEADDNSSRKESVSLSRFMELNNLEVHEELFTMATQAWAEVT